MRMPSTSKGTRTSSLQLMRQKHECVNTSKRERVTLLYDARSACECSLACSTCHVILPKEIYDKLPEPSEEEEDMLDLAFGLTNTYLSCSSRESCYCS